MKKGVLIILLAIVLLSSCYALSNPAAVYCKELGKEFGGYNYEIRENEYGEYGVCVVEGQELEEWRFLRGEIGKENSYCARKGMGIRTENGKAYCVTSSIISKEGRQSLSVQEVSVEELMELDSKLEETAPTRNKKILSESEARILLTGSRLPSSSIYNQTNYSFWDWRNPSNTTEYSNDKFKFFDNTYGWVTSVKDQSTCGSCWAFATVGSIESKYSIVNNDSRYNPDLSEQHEVSCDQTCYEDCPTCCQVGCGGGYPYLALKYVKNNGIVDENCFPYTATNNTCSNRCSDYQQRMWNITNFSSTWPEYQSQVWLSPNGTKQWLLDYGPLVAALYINTTNPGSGIHSCANDNLPPNHAVVLVGYNDTGNPSTSYWILKNQYGTGWGEVGYFKLGFGECNFTYEFDFPHSVNAPDFKPTVVLNSPISWYNTSVNETIFNFTVYNKVSSTSTCDLKINRVINQTNSSVNNGTATTFVLNLPEGNWNWSVNCWENSLGITNNSEIRSLLMDSTSPFLQFVSPQNITYDTNQILVNITNSSDAVYVWWNNGTTNITYNESIYHTFQDGQHTIYAWANDSVGNVNSTNITFSVDTSMPYIEIISPENITYTNVTILVNITNSSDADFVWFYNGTGNETYTNPVYRNFNEGINVLTAWANNSVGNINTTSVIFTIDTSNPGITIISPNNNSWYNALRFNVTLNEEGDSCWFSFNHEANKSMTKLSDTSFGYINTTVSATGDSNDYNVTFYCNDTVGNENFTNFVYFGIDKTSPSIVLDQPEDGDEFNEDTEVDFDFNVTDTLSSITECKLIADGTVRATDSSITKSVISTISYTFSSAGDYTCKINCTDSAGNIGSSSEIDITINAVDGGGGSSGSSSSTTTTKTTTTTSTTATTTTTTTSNDGTTYSLSEEEFQNGTSKNLKVNDKISFMINVTSHKLTLLNLTEDSATIMLESGPMIVTLNVSEEKRFDLNDDNYLDVYVKLEEIIGDEASIIVQGIYEEASIQLDESKILRSIKENVGFYIIMTIFVLAIVLWIIIKKFNLIKRLKDDSLNP